MQSVKKGRRRETCIVTDSIGLALGPNCQNFFKDFCNIFPKFIVRFFENLATGSHYNCMLTVTYFVTMRFVS